MNLKNKKFFAAFFLLILGTETFYPGISYALTSGPSQPEMQKFEPAGTNDMVDLFTGDFKYNIPLMDVGGYPVNLAYQSGTGIEDESSWVGAGWSLNPGAVNRNMRGLPDDFNGDKITKTYSQKEFQKVGGSITVKPSGLGWEIGKPSFKLNLYKDNYYGMGASIGAGLGYQLAKNQNTQLTAGLSLDINSDTRNGVNIDPGLSMSRFYAENEDCNKASLTGGLQYNTRGGLKSTSLGLSYNTSSYANSMPSNLDFSAVHYFGQSYTPTFNKNTANDQSTFSFDFGLTFFGVYAGVGGSGYVYKEHILDNVSTTPAYGYLNYLNGRKDPNVLLDFNREKDGVFIAGTPSIPVPVATQDFFVATGQTGSQQFRPFYSGDYTVFDKTYFNRSSQSGLGVTIGGGNLFKGGGRVENTNGMAQTGKWVNNNNYLTIAEPEFKHATPTEEPTYFKQIGEQTKADASFLALLGDNKTRSVKVSGSTSGAYAAAAFQSREEPSAVNTGDVRRFARDKRNYGFSFLSASQATTFGLDKKIKSYAADARTYNNEERITDKRKSHHISEITVTDNEGKRMVYGIPVYNKSQEEVTFSVAGIDPTSPAFKQKARTGITDYTTTDATIGNLNGRENLYSKQETPAYATSFLLTGILSTDYVDVKDDGITDDDLGTAVKFNYSKVNSDYQWRAPYELNKANFNEGFISDQKDDKANYTYGSKELWYLNSIESKTMIAVFETSDREDGLGVTNNAGGKNVSVRQKKLDRIKLYSKADWIKNGANAVPVKVVHFEYDYSLYPNVLNNTFNALDKNGIALSDASSATNVNFNKGKLTLRKVYFTFGTSTRGESNPYLFNYDMRPVTSVAGLPGIGAGDGEETDNYGTHLVDRWGTYKKSFYNHVVNGSRTLNNSEFPYTNQENVNTTYSERALDDLYASKWQLNQVTTPTGAIITVNYESDDYAYVQNRRAMQMCFIKNIQSTSNTTGDNLITADRLIVELPYQITGSNAQSEFQQRYLDGIDKMFYKVYTDLDNRGHYEYVYGYAQIDKANSTLLSDNKTASIALVPVNNANPIAKQAWQMLKTDLPQYAYDGYDNTNIGNDAVAAIRAIVFALGNLKELTQSFEDKARGRKYGNKVDCSKSMVRLNNPDFKKIGGGARVHSVVISDDWNNMSPTNASQPSQYGQVYDYTTTNPDIKDASGKPIVISSGVASYEPQIGNEENPFHEPVNFTEKVYWGSDKYHYVEKPYCETYFPAAQVGYSKVTVTSIGSDEINVTPQNHTGFIENEFYTAKEFPTLVDNTSLEKYDYENSTILKLFASTYVKRMLTSQGFKVELNDMHGKPKSVKVFNKAGDVLSSSEYFYDVKTDNAEVKELDNHVDVLDATGTISKDVVVGTDVELVSDVRQSSDETDGSSIGAYTGGMSIFIATFPYGAVNYNQSSSKKSYNSVCIVKVIHRYGIVKRVRTMTNGSVIDAENLLWDGETGQVLLTKTQNEFNNAFYTFTYPAYMNPQYEGMGSAYKNLGATVVLATQSDGKIPDSFKPYLFPGDELISTLTQRKAWVVQSGDGSYRLINKDGNMMSNVVLPGGFVWPVEYLVVRPGRRNLLAATAGTIISMNDPRVNGRIDFGVDKRILDAKAVQFNQQWSAGIPPVNTSDNHYLPTDCTNNGSSCICNCLKGLFDYLINTNQLFIQQSQNKTVGQLVADATAAGYNIGSCSIIDQNSSKLFYALTNNPIATTYLAKVGDCTISIRSSNSSAIAFYGLKSQMCDNSQVVNYSDGGRQTFLKTLYVDYNEVHYFTGTQTSSAVCNGPKLMVGGILPIGYNYGTKFRISDISQIPQNATINYANLYLFAYAQGFNPSSGDNNAHTLTSETAGITDFEIDVASTTPNGNCLWSGDFTSRGYYSSINSVTNHFQDFQLDISWAVENMVENNRTWLLLKRMDDTYDGLKRYATFCSQTFSDANKWPKVIVSYSVPDPVIATLQIDDCLQTGGCLDPISKPLNPYFQNVLGNWRPQASYVYTVNRQQNKGIAAQNGGTDIRNSGYYSTFTPFWNFTTNGMVDNLSADNTNKRWVWNSKSLYYDQKGNEVESVDPLKRYSSALFGYNQSVATAVAANARRNEIMFDGFEDYNFNLQTEGTPPVCPAAKHFDWGFTYQSPNWCSSSGCVVTDKAHSGKYSYKLTGATTVTKAAGNAKPPFAVFDDDLPTPTALLDYDNTGRYVLNANELANGFAPVNGKKQLLSLWVNDNNPTSNKIANLSVTINGTSYPVNTMVVPVVEGWKRLDLTFTAGSNFTLQLIPSGTVYVDDIRILPFDAQLNSYVYDDRTMRLSAQLDENNFATFYEYDEEGTPIRVKKETERGIMTLKETRQFYRKHN